MRYELLFTKYCDREIHRSPAFLLIIHHRQKFWPFLHAIQIARDREVKCMILKSDNQFLVEIKH